MQVPVNFGNDACTSQTHGSKTIYVPRRVLDTKLFFGDSQVLLSCSRKTLEIAE